MRLALAVVAILGAWHAASAQADTATITATGYAPARREAPSASASLATSLRAAKRVAADQLFAAIWAGLGTDSDVAKARLRWLCAHASEVSVNANPDGSASVTLGLAAATIESLRKGPRAVTGTK